ncbi:MAG: hypothetical protein KDA47_15640, partial [Planctomycetales bacterium]|nr:hypothetical protein [Planctomycetales bacterium]
MAVAVVALPSHHEVARHAIHRHGRLGLVPGDRGVHQELGADCIAGGVEPLGIDAMAVGVLVGGLPDHDRVARVVHRYIGIQLIPVKRGVD